MSPEAVSTIESALCFAISECPSEQAEQPYLEALAELRAEHLGA